MRTILVMALTIASMLPLQAPAAASVDSFQMRSARDLVDLCAVPDNDPMVEAARGFCYGFLSGVGGYHRAINAGEDARPLFCLPAQPVSRVEAARKFVDWSRAHPQYLGETPVDNLVRFAVATWPCK